MSLLPYATNLNETESYFIKTSQLSTITGNTTYIAQSTVKGWSLYPAVSPVNCANQPILSTNAIQLDNVTLTATFDELFVNGVPIVTSTAFAQLSSIADWAYFEAISSINAGNNDLYNVKTITSQNINNALNIQTDTLSALTSITSPKATITNISATNLSTINVNTSNINGSPYAPTSNWAQYPATTNVNMANHNLVSGSGNTLAVQADSNLTLKSIGSNVSINGGFNYLSGYSGIDISGGYTNITADGHIFNLALPTRININAKNGNRGEINIIADGGYSNAVPGFVNIVANGSVTASNVGAGGTIFLTANTPTLTSLTSRIQLSAACVESYAGYTGAKASLSGFNYMWGTLGAQVVASLLPPGFNTPGSVYLYGDTGVVCGSALYVYNNILPYWNGVTTPLDLNITGRYTTSQTYVNLSNVQDIYMDGNANIHNAHSITGNANSQISGFSNVSAQNINASNVNASNAVTATYGNFTYINGNPAGITSTFTNLYTSNLFASNAVVSSLTIGGQKPLTQYISTFNDLHTSSLSVSTINGSAPITKYISTFPNVYVTSNLYAPTVQTENITSQTTLAVTALNDITVISQAGGQLFLGSQYAFPGGNVIARQINASTINCYALNVSSINGVAQAGFIPF